MFGFELLCSINNTRPSHVWVCYFVASTSQDLHLPACLGLFSLSSVPWSIRPLTTHDVFIFKVRFLAESHMVRRDVSPAFSITWLRKRSLCPPLAFFPWTLPARMRSSSSPFRMMWPVKRACLSLMVLRSWRSCPIR